MPPRSQHIDTAPFADLIEEALRAFATDFGYAEQMAVRASLVLEKRRIWELRTRLRKAEAEAQARCARATPFECAAREPCGTGPACPYAPSDLRHLVLAPAPTRRRTPGRRSPGQSPGREVPRPQLGPGGQPRASNIEHAVRQLAQQRAA